MTMRIDLHIHTKNCSDGNLTVAEIFRAAVAREISLLSITDHDNTGCQAEAMTLARRNDIEYVPGVELNVTFSQPGYNDGKPVALDFLGYQYDIEDTELNNKLDVIAKYREERAKKVLAKLNLEFEKECRDKFTDADMAAIKASVDGVFGRPHIANYLVAKGIVKDKQEAFDRYLVKCDVPKYPLHLKDAAKLIHDAGGVLVLAHPNDPGGTSLVKLTRALREQTELIEDAMLAYIDGVECWHSRHDGVTSKHYEQFVKRHKLLATGGSDCHQNPIIMGTVNVPAYVAGQFGLG